MSAVTTAMDRFAAVIADPQTIEVVGQRVIEGESLKQIARSWELPVMKFVTWIIEDLSRLQVYQAALKVRADEMAHETIEIADDKDGDPRRDSLRVRTRMTLAGHWNREQYGLKSEKTITHQHRRLASELSDEELMALIDRERDRRAIPGESTPVEAVLELPIAKGDGII